MMFLVLIISACSTTQSKYSDYAQACVVKQDKDLAKNVSHECLPLDTYEDSIHYHQSYKSDYRNMPDLDSAMDSRP